jgi:hypothetical protein
MCIPCSCAPPHSTASCIPLSFRASFAVVEVVSLHFSCDLLHAKRREHSTKTSSETSSTVLIIHRFLLGSNRSYQ